MQRSTFAGLARVPLERAPEELAVAGAAHEAKRKIAGRRRFADLSAAGGFRASSTATADIARPGVSYKVW